MALSELQKKQYEEILKRHEKEIFEKDVINPKFIYYTIAEELEKYNINNYNFNSMNSALNRAFNKVFFTNHYEAYDYSNKDIVYIYHSNFKQFYKTNLGYVIEDTTFRKEKNRIYFNCKNNDFYYDFITKNFSKNLNDISGDAEWLISNVELYDYEWLFNYTNDLRIILDIIRTVSPQIYSTCPKGFANYLKENNYSLSADLLKNYYLKTKYGKYYNFIGDIYEDDLNTFLDYEKIENLFKVCTLSLLNGQRSFGVGRFIRNFNIVAQHHPSFKLDTNRDMHYNETLMRDIIDKERNEILSKKLQKLNFINGYTIDNYVIIVPQNQEEKQDEGKQQNNCVGYYYDDSILDGTNLIYFLRKKDEPKKSYITCRYNTRSKKTMEYRYKNNCAVVNEKEIKIIETIDDIIRKNLV